MNNILLLCDEHPAHIAATATAEEAIRAMIELNVGAIAIVDDQRVVAGIFTERDVLQKIALGKRDPGEIAITEVMTTPVVMATKEITAAEALAVMVEAHHRHLPIIDEAGRLLGMLSLRHVLQARIDKLVAQLASANV